MKSPSGREEAEYRAVVAWVRAGALSPLESDRLVRVTPLLQHAKLVFDNERDAAAWFSMPNQALRGETPLSWLGTDAGVHQVDDVLTRLEFGVYA